jgi:hypothetical protein
MSQAWSWLNRVPVVDGIAVAVVVAIASYGIVRAEHVAPDKNKTVFKCSSGTACLSGIASGSASNGVFGSASGANTHGVYGTSNWAGVTGYTGSSVDGSGVLGESLSSSGSGHGVYGASSNGPGVYGTSRTYDGAAGFTDANGQSAAYGESKGDGYAIVAETNEDTDDGNEAVFGVATAANGQLFNAYNKPNEADCTVNENAELTCSGSISGSTLRAEHRDSGGRRVLAFASESASPMIEDFGTARIVGGIATVQIDPAFASLMSRKWYYVSLTPLDDTRGLFVSVKTSTAFQVRESAHGRDSLAFDYRIVAHPLDAPNDRLPPAPKHRRPLTPGSHLHEER